MATSPLVFLGHLPDSPILRSFHREIAGLGPAGHGGPQAAESPIDSVAISACQWRNFMISDKNPLRRR
jgi:hypothetical protein